MTPDWVTEERFAGTWRAGHKRRHLPHLRDARRKIKDEVEAEKRGGARDDGGGRPTGSYGGRKLRKKLEQLKAVVKVGNLELAHIASRDPAILKE